VPQNAQNRAPTGSSAPQEAQRATARAYARRREGYGLQDAIARFSRTRGFAGLPKLEGVEGRGSRGLRERGRPSAVPLEPVRVPWTRC
jgi:hypothetical protein